MRIAASSLPGCSIRRLMAARYPAWSAATQQSVYHHLCALDLF
jgi:hypothetical protein